MIRILLLNTASECQLTTATTQKLDGRNHSTLGWSFRHQQSTHSAVIH